VLAANLIARDCERVVESLLAAGSPRIDVVSARRKSRARVPTGKVTCWIMYNVYIPT